MSPLKHRFQISFACYETEEAKNEALRKVYLKLFELGYSFGLEPKNKMIFEDVWILCFNTYNIGGILHSSNKCAERQEEYGKYISAKRPFLWIKRAKVAIKNK